MSLGFVLPALSVGLGSLLIKPKRGFFFKDSVPIVAQITIEEVHTDELEITNHPVEQGASITDHAFKLPAELVINCAWSNSPTTSSEGIFGALLNQAATATSGTINGIQSVLSGNDIGQIKGIYASLLAIQESRTPFDILTGKRVYNSMLIKSLRVATDAKTENSLMVQMTCKQIIIVSTQTVTVPINTQAQGQPQKTTPVQNAGSKQLQSAPNYKP